MRGLQLRVGLSHLRPGFAKPEAQLPEQSLTLANFQAHTQLAAKKLRQGRTVPHFGRQVELTRAIA